MTLNITPGSSKVGDMIETHLSEDTLNKDWLEGKRGQLSKGID